MKKKQKNKSKPIDTNTKVQPQAKKDTGLMSKPDLRNWRSPQKHVTWQSDKPSLTRQEFQEECNINTILEKFQTTGAVDHFNKKQGTYDFHTGIDFHTAMNMVTDAQNMFEDLPSSVRARFGNDPGAFHDFVVDPSNSSEIQQMGLSVNNTDKLPESLPEAPQQAPEETQASGASGPDS